MFTRPVTFILSGMTAVATSYAHAPRDFFPILNAGEFGSALLRRLSLPCRSRRRPVERREFLVHSLEVIVYIGHGTHFERVQWRQRQCIRS